MTHNLRVRCIKYAVKMSIIILLISCLELIFSWGGGQVEASDRGISIGETAPVFSLEGIDGKQYQIGGESGSKDKPTWIHFWASWCPPCQLEAPMITSLAEKYKDQVDVIAVNVTMYDNLKDAQAFVEKYHFTFPVLMDEQAEIYRKFRGAALPTHVLIDKNGIIKDYIVGALPKTQLEEKLGAMMTE